MSGDVLPHIQRLYDNSECRTPLVCCLEDGNPLKSIQALAKARGCAVWHIAMDSPKNEQNALDYLDVGLQNGDWVYLTHNELASQQTHREIALQLLTVVPNPKLFPKRELFRLWLAVEHEVDLDESVQPVFPTLLSHNALYGRARPESPRGTRLKRKKAVEPDLMRTEFSKRSQRREAGRGSDSESDAETAQDKRMGLWFHRSVDFYEADEGFATANTEGDVFTAIEAGDEEKAAQCLASNTMDVNQVLRSGMTPLFWAVMCDHIPIIRQVLEAGADPNQRRQGDGMPVIFLSLVQVRPHSPSPSFFDTMCACAHKPYSWFTCCCVARCVLRVASCKTFFPPDRGSTTSARLRGRLGSQIRRTPAVGSSRHSAQHQNAPKDHKCLVPKKIYGKTHTTAPSSTHTHTHTRPSCRTYVNKSHALALLSPLPLTHTRAHSRRRASARILVFSSINLYHVRTRVNEQKYTPLASPPFITTEHFFVEPHTRRKKQ